MIKQAYYKHKNNLVVNIESQEDRINVWRRKEDQRLKTE